MIRIADLDDVAFADVMELAKTAAALPSQQRHRLVAFAAELRATSP